MVTGDYGILSRNMQHCLNWGRKEYMFQYLLSTIAGTDPGEVKWVNFHTPFSEPHSFFFSLSVKYLYVICRLGGLYSEKL